MSQFFHQYFDFNVMGEHFSEVLEGFLKNLLLFAVAVVLALTWGLVLALIRQLPGKKFIPLRGLTIAYIDVLRAIPILIILLLISGGIPYLNFLPKDIRIPQWFGEPDPFWYGALALTLGLRRLYGRGLPGRNRSDPARSDGGRAFARHEPPPGDAPCSRPPGGDEDPGADAERNDLAAEGHEPCQRRRARASRSWSVAKSWPKRSTARR